MRSPKVGELPGSNGTLMLRSSMNYSVGMRQGTTGTMLPYSVDENRPFDMTSSQIVANNFSALSNEFAPPNSFNVGSNVLTGKPILLQPKGRNSAFDSKDTTDASEFVNTSGREQLAKNVDIPIDRDITLFTFSQNNMFDFKKNSVTMRNKMVAKNVRHKRNNSKEA